MPPEASSFLCAAVQMRSGVEPERNVAAALDLIAEAAARGARFIATPEMTNVLDRNADRLFTHLKAEDETPAVAVFAAAAQRHRVYLLIGSMAVRTGPRRAANRAFLFSPAGEIAARYDKIHRFDADLPGGEIARESHVYDAGCEAVLADTALARFGLSICYDVRFPTLYRRLAQAGAEAFCVPAAFTRPTGEAHWTTLLRARAIECGAYVIAPAQGGAHEDGRATFGSSMIIGPWGEILAERSGVEPGVIVAEIDRARVAEARARIPNLAIENEIRVRTVSG